MYIHDSGNIPPEKANLEIRVAAKLLEPLFSPPCSDAGDMMDLDPEDA
jgi:hypothetical protein